MAKPKNYTIKQLMSQEIWYRVTHSKTITTDSNGVPLEYTVVDQQVYSEYCRNDALESAERYLDTEPGYFESTYDPDHGDRFSCTATVERVYVIENEHFVEALVFTDTVTR